MNTRIINTYQHLFSLHIFFSVTLTNSEIIFCLTHCNNIWNKQTCSLPSRRFIVVIIEDKMQRIHNVVNICRLFCETSETWPTNNIVHLFLTVRQPTETSAIFNKMCPLRWSTSVDKAQNIFILNNMSNLVYRNNLEYKE